MQQPPMITYNLKERGRKHRGVERNFDIPAIVASVNSPETQERVKTRGMLGYFGHWPRVRFGMEPPEGGLDGGKAHSIEPAVVTTHLKAHDDGTIEHQTEFLDTATGQMAARMYSNRVGGFSTAIDPRKPELYGFDWVNDPNYSTNRGYDLVLDSVSSGEMTFDDVLCAEQNEQLDAMNRLFEMLEANTRMALDSASRFEGENRELLDMLSQRDDEQARSVLDSAGADEAKAQIERDRQHFLDSTALPRFQAPEKEKQQEDHGYLQLKQRVIGHV